MKLGKRHFYYLSKYSDAIIRYGNDYDFNILAEYTDEKIKEWKEPPSLQINEELISSNAPFVQDLSQFIKYIQL